MPLPRALDMPKVDRWPPTPEVAQKLVAELIEHAATMMDAHGNHAAAAHLLEATAEYSEYALHTQAMVASLAATIRNLDDFNGAELKAQLADIVAYHPQA